VIGSDLSSLLPSGVWRRRSSAACSARATGKTKLFVPKFQYGNYTVSL
jgi:hypothetical protein